jgi:polar amino acid transport system substrate-binding protein
MRRTFAYLMIALLLTAVAILGAAMVNAQEADHPSDKPMIVASDFGEAPWMVRGANGPEGFGADLTIRPR